ncbi:MAG: phosphotransferase [Breznakia sp.]
MIHTLIKKLFKSEQFTLVDLQKGISNKNYILSVHDEQYIVRVPFKDRVNTLSYVQEETIINLVKDLDVPTVYFDNVTGIKITKYIPQVYEYQECPFEDKIERVASLLKKLHSRKSVGVSFDPIAQLHYYQSHTKKPLYNLDAYAFIIDDIKHLQNPQTLCHNDIVDGNILFSDHGDYLIDYEYAADNDPLFDVMSFLSENNITNPDLRMRFYQAYFDSINDTILFQLTLWEGFHNLLWCYWAMMLYEKRSLPIYKQIADDKYQALTTMNFN